MDLRFSLTYLLYLAMVAVLSCMAELYLGAYVNYWIVLSALSLSLITIGETWLQRISVVGLTGAAIIFVFMLSYFAPPMSLHAIFIFCVTVVCMFAIQQNASYSYPIFIVNFFAIIYIQHQDFLKSIDSVLLGSFMALFLQTVFFFALRRAKTHVAIVSALQSLKNLSDNIFETFLKSEYVDNLYLFERRLHDRKTNFMQAVNSLRLSRHANSYLGRLENLYDILLSCAALRWRVGDHSTFSICENELTSIGKHINDLFNEVIKSITVKRNLLNVGPFMESIKQFEVIYQNVLQVAGREPYVFPIFIFDLQSLSKEMNHLNEMVLKIA